MAVTKIAQVDVGAGGAASISFSSIPSTFTDLLVVVSLRSTQAALADDAIVRLNGDSASNYTRKTLSGSGSAASSGGTTTTYVYLDSCNGSTSAANTFSNTALYIPNYASSNAKSMSIDTVREDNATAAYEGLLATLWTGTAAISSVVVTLLSAVNFAQYSSATLYGVTKGTSSGVTVA